MTDDVNIPPLPESQLAWINGRAVAWFTGEVRYEGAFVLIRSK